MRPFGLDSVLGVGFFLNDIGFQEFIDLALQQCSPIVSLIDGTGQRYEAGPKILAVLVIADLILENPK